MPGATYGCRASIVPLYKDAVIVEHSVARVLQEYAFLENLDGECINGRKTVEGKAMSGAGGLAESEFEVTVWNSLMIPR